METENTMHRLLIVDDDNDIRTLLAEQLGRAGYQVSTAADGTAMRQLLDREHVDLIVLDLNLPREDGLTLCRDLRARSNTPVIMLTARAEPIDRVLGLEMGADDYLAKPFEPRELLARIRNVLRRTEALPANLEPLAVRRARFSRWVFDLEHRHLVDPDDRVVVLSGAEFRLLRCSSRMPTRCCRASSWSRSAAAATTRRRTARSTCRSAACATSWAMTVGRMA
jgi:two-component system OmpR family response regulator